MLSVWAFPLRISIFISSSKHRNTIKLSANIPVRRGRQPLIEEVPSGSTLDSIRCIVLIIRRHFAHRTAPDLLQRSGPRTSPKMRHRIAVWLREFVDFAQFPQIERLQRVFRRQILCHSNVVPLRQRRRGIVPKIRGILTKRRHLDVVAHTLSIIIRGWIGWSVFSPPFPRNIPRFRGKRTR